MRNGMIVVGLLAALVPSVLRVPGAQAADQSGDVVLDNFHFEKGAALPSLKLHYLTLGTPRRDTAGAITNAVLLLHGTTGTADAFLQLRFRAALYGPGKPLDLASHYLIIPDGIGAGGSSKPSDGLNARFPRYGYQDQVRSQHEMLARVGVKHLTLVLGTSMGGMQTWLWAETYPGDADAFVPIAATPAAISGRNAVWRQIVIQAIRDDPDWKGGDYPKDKPPHAWARTAMPLFSIMTTNAEVLQKEAPTRGDAIKLVDTLAARASARDANDLLYQFESSYDYDPAPRLGAITKPVLAINFADDLLNPPDLLHLPDSAGLSHVMLPAGPHSYGHETLAHPDIWAPALADFLVRLNAKR